jgi:hypothetical protein
MNNHGSCGSFSRNGTLKWQRCAGLPHKQENPFKNKKKCTFTCNIFLKNQQSVQKLAKI